MNLPPIDDNVHQLPVKIQSSTRKPLQLAEDPHTACQHRHIDVDQKNAEVVCRDCKEKLNPIWVLQMLSTEDDRLIDRWARLRARIESMEKARSTKCRHCKKMTPIPTRISEWDVMCRAHEIKRQEDPP